MDLDQPSRRPSRLVIPSQNANFVLKFLLIGDPAVGEFDRHYKPTIGADFSLKTIYWDNETTLNVLLWDLAGHDRFGYMTRPYFKNAVGCGIVFDVSRRSTFVSLAKWLKEVREKVVFEDGANIPLVILANKSDSEEQSVTSEDISKFCKENQVDNWFYTSAKEGTGVDESMYSLIERAVEMAKKQKTHGFELQSSITSKKPNSCCS